MSCVELQLCKQRLRGGVEGPVLFYDEDDVFWP